MSSENRLRSLRYIFKCWRAGDNMPKTCGRQRLRHEGTTFLPARMDANMSVQDHKVSGVSQVLRQGVSACANASLGGVSVNDWTMA